MSRSFITLAALLTAVAATFISLQAQAVQRTHVSAAFGADSNTATNCTATAPCRFFQAAMTVTDINGEVIVLDSGGYGAVTITQSVALIAPTGVYAGISVFPGSNGVTIATAGVNVVLRGLTINGQGGNNGIYMSAGSMLSVENCAISNFPTSVGINVSSPAKVRIFDTIVRNIGFGIYLMDGPVATISRSTFVDNSYGIIIRGLTAGTTTTADISDSTVSGSVDGITALSTVANAIVRVSVSTGRVTGNTTGLRQIGAGASLRSFGNNTLAENAFDTFGTIGQITLK